MGLLPIPTIILIIIFIVIIIAIAGFLVFMGIISFQGKSDSGLSIGKSDDNKNLQEQVKEQKDQIDELNKKVNDDN
jgi:peptidoglycan hydrolase CwlO-like protein